MTSQPRLANLLSALSQVSDLGMGLEPEAALRVCLFATSLGRELDLDDKTLSDTFYTALLQHSGCTVHADETALALGDDVTHEPGWVPDQLRCSVSQVSMRWLLRSVISLT